MAGIHGFAGTAAGFCLYGLRPRGGGVLPGQPVTAHWGIEDPVIQDPGDSTDREERLKPFKAAFVALQQRWQLFMNLPVASLDRVRLQAEVDRIGKTGP